MSLKLNSSFFCALCIFSIFVEGIPFDNFKQAPTTDSANLSLADQILEMYKETTSDYFKPETKNTEKQLCKSMLTTLASPKGNETIGLSMVKILDRISNRNRDTQQIMIRNIFNILDSCMKQNVADNDLQPFLEELRKFAAPSINLNNDFSVDALRNERSLMSEHQYVPRGLEDDLDGPDVPSLDLMLDQNSPNKARIENSLSDANFGHRAMDSRSQFDTGPQSTSRQKSRRGKNLRSLFSVASSTNNVDSNELLGNKIFLFKNNVDSNELLGNKIFLFNKDPDNNETKDNKSHFLFR